MTQAGNRIVGIALCTVGWTTMLLGSLLLTSDRRLVLGLISFGVLFATAGYLKLKQY